MVAIHWLQMLSYIFMDPSDTINDTIDDFEFDYCFLLHKFLYFSQALCIQGKVIFLN